MEIATSQASIYDWATLSSLTPLPYPPEKSIKNFLRKEKQLKIFS
jgi:hypothetical protein